MKFFSKFAVAFVILFAMALNILEKYIFSLSTFSFDRNISQVEGSGYQFLNILLNNV